MRLDSQLRSALQEFVAKHGVTTSQAVRTLLDLSLHGPEHVRTRVIHEGITAGLGIFKRRLSEAVDVAIGDIAAELALHKREP